jgi:outer membrane lipoprotein-sorting protein
MLAALATTSIFLASSARAGEAPPPEEEPKADTEKETEKKKPVLIIDGKPDVDAILKHFNNLYRSKTSESRARLKIIKPRRTRTMKLHMWTEGEDRALIIVEGPAKYRGQASLKVDDNLWSYDPRIDLTIRIPPSMMLGSWMGSDFTNDDLVRESSYTDDYDAELVGPSKKPDPEGWLIRLKVKKGVVGLWKTMEFVISKDGTLPILSRYYDRKGRLARIMESSDVKDFGGRTVPARMTLTPVDKRKKGYSTIFIYDSIKFDVELPKGTFEQSALRRKR